MTRKSKRELERALDDLEPTDNEPPETPPQPWMASVPQHLWTDPVAVLRHWAQQADAAEADQDHDWPE